LTLKRSLQAAEYLFAVTGILACGYWAIAYFRAQNFQTQEASAFSLKLRGKEPVVTQPPPREGAVFAQLAIPRLGLSTMVVEGDRDEDLKEGVGHIPVTAMPREHGNVGLAGHRDTFFRPLQFIRKNDVIGLRTVDGSYTYLVTSTQIVDPSDVQVLDPTPRDSLTLVTCYPFHFIGSAPKRFIVRAERIPG